MSYLEERIAYVQGLAKGLGIDREKSEGKVLTELINVMEEMADTLAQLEMDQIELEDYVGAIDDDLRRMEEVHEWDEEADETYYEIQCPTCGMILELNADDWDDRDTLELICPGCGETIGDGEQEETIVDQQSPDSRMKNHSTLYSD